MMAYHGVGVMAVAMAIAFGRPVIAAEATWHLNGENTAYDLADVRLAQFQLPHPISGDQAQVSRLPTRLTYQYGYGSESDITYRRNPDLNKRVRDNALIATPELNGHMVYRPTDWLETTLEMILEREIAVKEEDRITLPNGELQFAPKRRFSLLVDQAFITIKKITDPFELSIGRRNFEDNRHWLYDTSMDIVMASLKGKYKTQLSVGRETLLDLDLFKREKPDRINTYILHTEYRGIEDLQLAGYMVYRDDRNRKEGRPWLMGLRSLGHPTDEFSFWTELAHLRGKDESSRNFSAYAIDVGGTYRFTGLPFNPNVTLGYAFATGDDPGSNKNNEFRQTGLQSNEARFAGVSEFRFYGEALDPELSNLRILTLGLGFRPTHNMSLDLVYHKYRLDEIAEEIRNSRLTALMNQDDTRSSKDAGSGFDVVLGVRSLFGVRRLGLDLRAGWFFPGKAFRIDEGDDSFRDADKGVSMVFKFWW